MKKILKNVLNKIRIFVSLTLNFRYILSMLKENSVTFVTSHFFCLIAEYFCNSPNKLPSKKWRFFWNLWLIVISTQECVQYGHCPQVNDEKNEIFHSFSIRLIWSPTYYCVEIFILIFFVFFFFVILLNMQIQYNKDVSRILYLNIIMMKMRV